MEHFEVKDLSFSYPLASKKALDNVNLKINKGEYVTICGKSGSGKSTLLNHLKPVLAPFGEKSGEIFFCGVELGKISLREQASKIGFVMQNPDNQIVTDKVWHELAFGLENLGIDQKIIRLRVGEMANYFGIEGWFHQDVAYLSGGQKQLLNLAAVMAMQPEVLILDEPTSQLDPIAAADFLNTVKKINLELGTTVIITEHRLENVFHSSDRVVVMENGKIIANDNPRKIGDILRIKDSDMFCAMPTPIQIFYGVSGKGECPLTVREGRNWLSGVFEEKDITTDNIEIHDFDNEHLETAIEMKEVWFRYEKDSPDVLKGLSLVVPKGKFLAVVGGNGAGKSTMLKTICGVNRPYSGKVIINGKNIKKYKSSELFYENLSMIPQDPLSLFVHNTVKEDLEEMLPKGITKKQMEDEIAKVSQATEITKLLSQHPMDLSGGEQQRAALAKILLAKPKILILDEPTKGIDDFYKEKLALILKGLLSKQTTIVMVSHDIEFCAKYADLVSMFFDHSILTTNNPNSFFSQNSFYTTAANRMSRHIFKNTITNEDVIKLCKINLQ